MSTDKISDGARQLATCGTLRSVAGKIGCSHELVARWRKGVCLPGAEHRARLREVFGIPLGAWDPPPGSTTGTSVGIDAVDDDAAEAPGGASALPSDRAGLDSLIAQLEGARAVPDVAPTVLARLAAVEVRARSARAAIAPPLPQVPVDEALLEIAATCPTTFLRCAVRLGHKAGSFWRIWGLLNAEANAALDRCQEADRAAWAVLDAQPALLATCERYGITHPKSHAAPMLREIIEGADVVPPPVLEAGAEPSEAQVLASPAWHALRDKVVHVLEAHPAAFDAVLSALSGS